MWRSIKLFFNLLITSLIFNYFITILTILLNPNINIKTSEFWSMFLTLFVYYVPLWCILIGILFFIIQFFAEKKYPIGIFNPPTLTYFLSFSILIISFIFFMNYDYYLDFFSNTTKTKFIKILMTHLILIVFGIVFIFFKRINKKWLQILFLLVLSYNMLTSYAFFLGNGDQKQIFTYYRDQSLSPEFTPRKIRIVFMNGLSLSHILSISSEQKLMNFKLLIKNGVSGKFLGYKPNLTLSMTSSALTGLKPFEFDIHSDDKFKFSNIDHEFDNFPKYIFFRTSSNLNITAIYKREDRYLDHINQLYERNNNQTIHLLKTPFIDPYSEKSLYKNNDFILFFSEIISKQGEKYGILKKTFFKDEYIRNINSDLKETNKYYSIVQFYGLTVISKYFYQYYMPNIFGNISENDSKNYGWLFEQYYEYYDKIIGNLITSTGEDELLVIISLFEYEPLPLWRRILVNLFSQKDIYVYKSLKSEGSILLYEKNALKKGYPLKTISIFDIFPTLIYYSGFQLPKNIDGEVIREIFTDDFILNNPIRVSTHSEDHP